MTERLTPAELSRITDIREFAAVAERVLDRSGFDYIAGGSGEEITLAENAAAFRRRRLRARVLVDVSDIDLSTRALGSELGMPVGVAPMAFQDLAHPDAELGMARAAAAAGAIMCLSTLSSVSLEAVAEANGDGVRWFQLYIHRDRGVSEDLVKRAEAAGYSAIAWTVDLPVAGTRHRDVRNELAYPSRFGNFTSEGGAGLPLAATVGGLNDVTLTWNDLDWLRGLTSLPIVIKGVMTVDDARRAVLRGASGVWVSNHGGRQLDRAPATLDVLDEIVSAVGGRAEVYLDGGVMGAADVVTALAMGARAVFMGKALNFALAAGGEAGVARALELLRSDMETTMALLGAVRVTNLSRRSVTDGS